MINCLIKLLAKYYNFIFKIPILSNFLNSCNELFKRYYFIFGNKRKNTFVVDGFFTAFIFVITVILGIDFKEETLDCYKKKYIIMNYMTIILLGVVNNITYNKNSLFLMLILIIFFTILSGINLIYSGGTLEKELGYFRLVWYSFWKLFFEAKTYIYFILIIKLCLIESIDISVGIVELEYSKQILNIVNIIFFLFLHLVVDIKDRFDYFDFYKMSNELDGIESKNNNYINDDTLEMLGFLVYVEDRDFFRRRKFKFSITRVIERKIFYENFISKFLKKIKTLRINSFRGILNRLRMLIGCNLRGYSTIEQQVIRRVVMKPYSYDYTLRRKVFIESIYLKNFIEAYKIKLIKDKGLKRNILNSLGFRHEEKLLIERRKSILRKNISKEIKLRFLIYYFNEIYNKPSSMQELFQAIQKESIQTLDSLEYKYIQYSNSCFKNYIEEILLTCKNGGIEMINYKELYRYDQANKKIYIHDGKKFKVLSSLASRPVLIDHSIIYIYPFDFEVKSNIYMYNLKKHELIKLYSWKEGMCPKTLEWHTEELIFVILGSTYGTVDIGGDLYLLNIYSKSLRLIRSFPPNIQINKIKKLSSRALEIRGLRYLDKEMNSSKPYENIISL